MLRILPSSPASPLAVCNPPTPTAQAHAAGKIELIAAGADGSVVQEAEFLEVVSPHDEVALLVGRSDLLKIAKARLDLGHRRNTGEAFAGSGGVVGALHVETHKEASWFGLIHPRAQRLVVRAKRLIDLQNSIVGHVRVREPGRVHTESRHPKVPTPPVVARWISTPQLASGSRHVSAFLGQASHRCPTVPTVNPSEQAVFAALVAELDGALARLDEPPVRDHPAFSIEPDWFPDFLCVTAQREDAADLRFMLTGDDWIRVDIAGLSESLEVPLPGNVSRAARKQPPMVETLTRLLTSRATVTYRRRRADLFLTDAAGRIWCRTTYWNAMTLPPGFARGEPREFSALCHNPA